MVPLTTPSDEEWDDAAPRPEALIESLRSFGYSPETAIADLVDNSISASSRNVELHFVWEGADSHVAIVDDGRGMGEPTLVEAMRPGAVSPLLVRRPKDLGRFGLGLKTASFSQARELTVISRTKAGTTCVRRWDLDLIAESAQWRLVRTPAVAAIPYVRAIEKRGGTAVVWTKCDHLVGPVDQNPELAADRFYQTVDRISKHLGMTFHRFLTGRGALAICVNGSKTAPWDPILKHSATHQLPREDLPLSGASISVTPYVLPHRSKLDPAQQSSGAGIRGWNAHQGFYVYRNNRLVVAGDWLGTGVAKDEHTKLARIVVDFDASLDMAWQIDVKKSTARPPGTILPLLKRIALATRRQAEEVYRHRGRIVSGPGTDRTLVFAWQEYKERSGSLRLRVNRKHPVVAQALAGPAEQKRAIERVLRFVEETVPTTLIGIRIAEALDHQAIPYENDGADLKALLKYSMKVMTDAGDTKTAAIDRLSLIEPFSGYPGLLEGIREESA